MTTQELLTAAAITLSVACGLIGWQHAETCAIREADNEQDSDTTDM